MFNAPDQGPFAQRFSILMADERGSVVAVANGAGNVTAINSYDEYGIPGTDNQGRFQYTGQAWLPELGLYHYKARIYSPTLGRFLQTDPIGYEDGLNLYAYAGNDPINRTDPTGMQSEVVVSGRRERDRNSNCSTRIFSDDYRWNCRNEKRKDDKDKKRRNSDLKKISGTELLPQKTEEPSTLENIWNCTKDQYGFGEDDNVRDAAAGVGRAASETLAIPLPKETFGMRRHPGTSPTTNVMNAISHKTRIGAGINIPGQYGRMAGRVFGSARLLTVLGRANMITGAAFALYDAGSISYCTYNKGQ